MEHIDSNASPKARQYIKAARNVLYSVKMLPVIKQMITGGKTLVKGCAPFVANMVMKMESKMGPLEQQDEAMLILHICGSIVDMAKELHDPEVKNSTKQVVAQMMLAVHQMMGGQTGQPQQPSPLGQMQPQQGAPPPPQQPPQGGGP